MVTRRLSQAVEKQRVSYQGIALAMPILEIRRPFRGWGTGAPTFLPRQSRHLGQP